MCLIQCINCCVFVYSVLYLIRMRFAHTIVDTRCEITQLWWLSVPAAVPDSSSKHVFM